MRVYGRVSVVLVGLALTFAACKKDAEEPAKKPAAEPAAATPAAPTEPEWVRPKPAETAEGAFRDLFDAMKTRDRREIEARLVSLDECRAITGDEKRCVKLTSRNAFFLEALEKAPLPAEAHIRGITLFKSEAREVGEEKAKHSVKIQPGHIQLMLADGVSTLGPLAAIQVEGGWRILPGKPQPRKLQARPSKPTPGPKAEAKPAGPAPKAEAKPTAPAAPAGATPVAVEPPGGSDLARPPKP